MKVRVVVGFVEPAGFTRVKGDVVELDNAYATELVELGKVELLDDQPKASKAKSKRRKASKKQ
jgi:hypothetical protein